MANPYDPSGGSSVLPPVNDVTSDDKLWALLAYVLSPIIPIVILLMPDKKDRPFLKAHNYQALALGIIQVVLGIISPALICLPALAMLALWVAQIYWGIQAYNGKYVTIPWLSGFVNDFVHRQGWA